MAHSFSRREILIIVMDGILGVLIGALSIGSRTAESPLMTDKLGRFLTGAGFSGWILGGPMLLATVVLAPALLLFLRSQAAS